MFSIGKGKIGEATKILFNVIIGATIGWMVSHFMLQPALGTTNIYVDEATGQIFNLADLTLILIGLFLAVGGVKMGKGMLRDIGIGWASYAIIHEVEEWVFPAIRTATATP